MPEARDLYHRLIARIDAAIIESAPADPGLDRAVSEIASAPGQDVRDRHRRLLAAAAEFLTRCETTEPQLIEA